MPLQDLTPQLRTRLSRMERTVGWFVMLAGVILLAGFIWYLYSTAERKGWFVVKLNYATGMDNTSGLKPGDPVKLLGISVGEITLIEPNPPGATRGVTIFFNIRQPYYGYVWVDSTVRLVSDFLGHVYLEVVQGKNGAPTAVERDGRFFVMDRKKAYTKFRDISAQLKSENSTRSAFEIATMATNQINSLLTNEINGLAANATREYYITLRQSAYNQPIDQKLTNWIYVPMQDSPSLSDRLEAVANKIETALPNILNLTNQISAVLTNASTAIARLDRTLVAVQPIVTNVTTISENLRNPEGSLGEWLIPTNLNNRLQATLETAQATLKTAQGTLKAAHSTIDDTDTNLTVVAADLDKTLIHLADLTSNLNWQVQSNTNLVSEINLTIAHTDDLVQGLKRHWFLRSAFKKKPEKK